MDPSAPGAALAALGEDLSLLSIRARDGTLMTRRRAGTVCCEIDAG